MKSIRSVFVALVVFLLLGLPAMAKTEIYSIGTSFLVMEDPTVEERLVPIPVPYLTVSFLNKIDPIDGTPTPIGPVTDYTQCTGLDIHPVTQDLYAVCNRMETNGELNTKEDPFQTMLLTLDKNTGQPTEIGPIEIPREDFVSDISFRSDGTLFAHINGLNIGVKEATTKGESANSLAIIDTQNGNTTIVGTTGVEDFWSAIGFTPQDDLLQCTDNDNFPGMVNILNQATGNAAFLEYLNYPPEFDGFAQIMSKDFDLASGQFIATLFTEGKCCEEILTTNSHLPTGSYLVSINPKNGAISYIGQISGFEERFSAIAVYSERTAVPTLSEWGLISMAALLGIVGFMVVRRRQVAA